MSSSERKYDYLRQLYYNPKSTVAYSSFSNLYKFVKKDKKFVFTPAEIEKWLSHQSVYTKYKSTKNKSGRDGQVHIFDKGRLVDLDTAYLNKSKVSTNKYLIAVDAYTKEMVIYPISKLTGDNVVKGLKYIFKELGPHLPVNLRTDRGTEMVNSKVKLFLKEKGINHILAQPPNKAFFAERGILSSKRLIEQLLHTKQSKTASWLSVYKDAQDIYNSRYHKSIGMSPKEASMKSNRRKVIKHVKKMGLRRLPKNPGKFRFQLGQSVRVKLFKQPGLSKSHTQTFSNELYQIVDRFMRDNVHFYKLKQLNYDLDIEGTFKDHELTKAFENNDSFLTVDKVLKKSRTINNIKHRLVTWKETDQRSYVPETYLSDKKSNQSDRLVMT